MLEIVWSVKAVASFKIVLDQIESKWSFQTASKFTVRTNKLIRTLQQNPFLFTETNIPNVRKAIITKQTSLLYKVNENHLEILFFWNNRQEPIF